MQKSLSKSFLELNLLNYGLRLSSDVNHVQSLSMQMVYVSRETHTICMLKVVKWLVSLNIHDRCIPLAYIKGIDFFKQGLELSRLGVSNLKLKL